MRQTGRRIAIAIGLTVSVALSVTDAAHADPVIPAESAVGEWRQPQGDRVQIYRCREGICGRIVKLVDPSRRDESNPDPHLRKRPLLGIHVISTLRRSGNNGWKVDLYQPKSGNTVSARVFPRDHNNLFVSYCYLFSLVCHDETWARVR
jgi:uncharacterized protein (DUF2147 family)